jgi:hypothetical protein
MATITMKRKHKNLEIPATPERATHEYLQQLLRMLVLHCQEYMRTVPPEKRRASHLNVIRCLLKDNGVAFDAAHKVSPARALQALDALTLPFGAKGH